MELYLLVPSPAMTGILDDLRYGLRGLTQESRLRSGCRAFAGSGNRGQHHNFHAAERHISAPAAGAGSGTAWRRSSPRTRGFPASFCVPIRITRIIGITTRSSLPCSCTPALTVNLTGPRRSAVADGATGFGQLLRDAGSGPGGGTRFPARGGAAGRVAGGGDQPCAVAAPVRWQPGRDAPHASRSAATLTALSEWRRPDSRD